MNQTLVNKTKNIYSIIGITSKSRFEVAGEGGMEHGTLPLHKHTCMQVDMLILISFLYPYEYTLFPLFHNTGHIKMALTKSTHWGTQYHMTSAQ